MPLDKNKKNIYPMSQAIRQVYRQGQEDETLEPLVLMDGEEKPVGTLRNGDYIIFYNIRGEREVELSRSLLEDNFSDFPTERDLRIHMATMIQYDPDLPVKVAFPPEKEIRDTLSETVSKQGLRQVKVVESEKAVHITFYLNGKIQELFPGEDREIVPSPKIEGEYDQIPEMRIAEVCQKTIEKLNDPQYGLVVANFCNTDVVGHVENKEAIRQAVQAVDTQVGRAVEAARRAGVTTLITADHGTVEKWYYPDGAIDTGHTNSPVPFILVEPDQPAGSDTEPGDAGSLANVRLREGGALPDVAPTALAIMGLDKPAAMTGRSLLENHSAPQGRRRRLFLLILDGWGVQPPGETNLISQAETPNMDRLLATCPNTTLTASGPAVGLPEGKVGNSEAGHLHLGAGRRILSDRSRIDAALEDGSFFHNEAFEWALDGALRDGTNLHLLGIVSFYSSHGTIQHLFALMEWAKRKRYENLYIHSILGRRGEQPESGAIYIQKVEEKTEELGLGQVVSVIGRYWALDREENWDRVEKCYRQLVYGEGSPVTGE
jgi:2,3-bisphosphoglycerate-independent phosphoglycerate mutase